MSLTPSDCRYHAIYEALPVIPRHGIDEAYRVATNVLTIGTDHLYKAPGDDRAECLIAAITRYLVESNPEDAAIKAAVAEVDL